MLFEYAQDVGDLLTAIRAGAAPADYDPLADIGRGEPDLEPVAHASHLFPRIAVSRGYCPVTAPLPPGASPVPPGSGPVLAEPPDERPGRTTWRSPQ